MISDEDKQKGLVFVRDFVNATKDFVDVGMYLFPAMGPHGAIILGCAYFAKNLIAGYGPDDKQEILDALGELKTQMNTLLDRMAGHFTAFKSFYVENHFYNDVPLATTVLFEYMLDANTDPSEDSLKEFKRLYNRKTPLTLARTLIHQLENDVSNPLKKAMEADPLMSTSTFLLWKQIIESIFTQLWEIEIKAGVLIHELEVESVDEMPVVVQVKEEIEKYQELIKKWEEEFQTTNPYWPDKVRRYVEDIQDKNEFKSVEETADEIQKGLDKIYTKSVFYILVFPDSYGYAMSAHKPDMNIISKRSGSTVVVYNSAECRNAPFRHIQRTNNDLNNFLSSIKDRKNTGMSVTDEWVEKWTRPIRDTGLLLAVKAESGVAIRSTKVDFRKEGPGGYGYGALHFENGTYYRKEPFFLLAGFR